MNRFKLRCYPNENQQLLVGIQLMALPVNRPNKDKASGLTTKCVLSEITTETRKPFDAVFDYSRRGSAHYQSVMESGRILDIEEGKELKFRMEIAVMGL